MSDPCPSCGGTDFYTNDSTAETTCTTCGSIINSNVFVEALSFSNSSMNGQIVGVNDKISAALGTGAENQSANRAMTLERGFNSITNIAEQLGLSQQIIQGAQRLYALALNQKATKGRREFISTACIYATCRRDKRPFMLIDFSDVVEIPVKTLGQSFMRLARRLKLDIPTIDPSLYLERFAQKIPLIASRYREISSTALKIVQMMDRDWITLGRRPAGIVGTGILIACRIHGFKINSVDIAHLVRLSSTTIDKRVREVMRSALMMVEDEKLNKTDIHQLENQKLPPRELERMAMRHKKAWGLLQDRVQGLEATELCKLLAEISEPHMSVGVGVAEIKPEATSDVEPVRQGMLADASDLGEEDCFVNKDFEALNLNNEKKSNNNDDDDFMNDLFGTEPDVTTSSGGVDLFDDLFGDLTAENQNSELVVKEEEQHNAYEAVDISEANEVYFEHMILDIQQRRAKALVWDELTKDYMPKLEARRADRKMREKNVFRRSNNKRPNGEEYLDKLTQSQKELFDQILN